MGDIGQMMEKKGQEQITNAFCLNQTSVLNNK
jgi:hypothetical protein